MQAWLAASTALEHASIAAFERLALELAHHGADPDLVARARDAAVDERRHTLAKSSLARAAGAAPSLHEHAPLPIRTLAALARENAIEGCVRETWGALHAWWQSLHAEDHATADVLSTIADDETRHAQLAWDVHVWALSRLDVASRRSLETTLCDAAATLVARGDGTHDPALRQRLGVASINDARSLLHALDAALWKTDSNATKQ